MTLGGSQPGGGAVAAATQQQSLEMLAQQKPRKRAAEPERALTAGEPGPKAARAQGSGILLLCSSLHPTIDTRMASRRAHELRMQPLALGQDEVEGDPALGAVAMCHFTRSPHNPAQALTPVQECK